MNGCVKRCIVTMTEAVGLYSEGQSD
uniref:Uncharacterized protein n=1 Tax=Anguilla anguilla TaxID=7936 RepID=A0A0E9SNM5_ANGAN